IDTTAPSAVATVTAIDSDAGTSGSDFVTNVASQTVSGTFTSSLGAGETIQVSANGGTTWVDATPSGSTFSASGVALSSGNGTLSVRTIDGVGNVTAGTGHSYTLDTTDPTVASILHQSPASNGPTNADSLTFRVTFSEAVGHLDANDFVVGGTTATI